MDKFIALFKDEHTSNGKSNLKNSKSSPVSRRGDKNKDKDNNNKDKDKEHKDKDKDDYLLARFTDKEKDEIVATLRICTMKHKPLKEREEEFTTMCISNGVSSEDAETAKELFLYREPDNWEMNILALEKGEWASSMATENFKRWRKVRPALRTDSIFFKKDGATPLSSSSAPTSPATSVGDRAGAPAPGPATAPVPKRDAVVKTDNGKAPPLPPRDVRHSNRW